MSASSDAAVDECVDRTEQGDAQAWRIDRSIVARQSGRGPALQPPQGASVDAPLDGLLRWFYGGSEPAEPAHSAGCGNYRRSEASSSCRTTDTMAPSAQAALPESSGAAAATSADSASGSA